MGCKANYKSSQCIKRMSLVIFFGMALIIFVAGLTILAITFYHWIKDHKLNKQKKQDSLISQETL